MTELYDTNPGEPRVPLRATTDGALRVAVVSGGSGGGGGSGTSDTTEATQLLVRAAVQSIDGKTPALAGGKVPVTDPTALPLPAGAATAALQGTANTSLGNLDLDLGAQADAAATSDAGTFSLIALIKRGLGNWTTLLARIPALVSNRMPVDGSGVTQPVSAAALPLPSGAATSAKQDTLNARLSRMGGLAMAETEETGSTVYVLHRSSIDSAMSYVVVRYVTTGGAVAIRYAGAANNPTMTTSALAWTNRATLVYGSLSEA